MFLNLCFYGFCLYVLYMCGFVFFSLLFFKNLIHLILTYLFSKEKEREGEKRWMGKDAGRVIEESFRIDCMKVFFSIKKKQKIPWLIKHVFDVLSTHCFLEINHFNLPVAIQLLFFIKEF